MTITTDFPYPKDSFLTALRDMYAELNGPQSFQPEKAWDGDNWSARAYCSRGSVLEKAGFSRLHIAGGTIEETPASLSFLETIAYPANPCLPGFVIMTNMNEKQDIGRTVVFYADLIIQNGRPVPEAVAIFSGALQAVCIRFDQDFEELNRFGAGQGLMGGIAAECGFVYLFQEQDIAFVEACCNAVLAAYRQILGLVGTAATAVFDETQLHRSRARLVEWIIAEDYGIKLARENGVPMEFIETYAFPAVVKY
ncbi:MAG: hypothetical protein GY868_02690 [Deltaproteobacteria bacterium]|nr:hypothetical protein [Deltaproteobacteria bacterium]